MPRPPKDTKSLVRIQPSLQSTRNIRKEGGDYPRYSPDARGLAELRSLTDAACGGTTGRIFGVEKNGDLGNDKFFTAFVSFEDVSSAEYGV